MDLTFWLLLFLGLIYAVIPTFLLVVKPPRVTQEDLYRRKRALVLVLGDLDRSPRMNYHALSLAKGGLDVWLCGYVDESKKADSTAAVCQHERITIVPFPQWLRPSWLPWILFAMVKVVKQHWYMFQLLRNRRNFYDFIIVQNPPSIPTLAVTQLFVLFMSTRTCLVIDWHNLGFSILALKLGRNHPLVWIHKLYEMVFGRRAYIHLTVTVGLAAYLQDAFRMNGRRILPLHDRPGPQFHPLSASEKQDVIKKYSETLFKGFEGHEKEKIVVTATSYTPDEDLYVLVDALKGYSNANKLRKGPKLLVIVTGKGPMLQEMTGVFEKLDLPDVTIRTAWISTEDYPKVLGTADVGVSLHQSSSGWDLPMKALDMFGCGLPVVSVDFPALKELVRDGVNGKVVKTAAEMTMSFLDLFGGSAQLSIVKKGALDEAQRSWDDNWNTKVGPLFSIGEYDRKREEDLEDEEYEHEHKH